MVKTETLKEQDLILLFLSYSGVFVLPKGNEAAVLKLRNAGYMTDDSHWCILTDKGIELAERYLLKIKKLIRQKQNKFNNDRAVSEVAKLINISVNSLKFFIACHNEKNTF